MLVHFARWIYICLAQKTLISVRSAAPSEFHYSNLLLDLSTKCELLSPPEFHDRLLCVYLLQSTGNRMNNFHYSLSAEQLQSFQECGYLLVRSFFTSEESELLREWAQEVHDLPCTPDVPWMPYQEVNSEGKRVLCRTENFANSHAGFDSFLRGQRATSVLEQLAGEEMLLFKEKINYKLAGSGK